MNNSIDFLADGVNWTTTSKNNLKCSYKKTKVIRSYSKDSGLQTVFIGASILVYSFTEALVFLIYALSPVHTMFGGISNLFGISLTLFISGVIFFITLAIDNKLFNNRLSQNKEYDGFVRQIFTQDCSQVFHLTGVTPEQVGEIAQQLNKLKKDENTIEYMKIVDKVIKSNAEYEETLKLKNKKASAKEKKTKLEKLKNNPYLNGELYKNELREITEDFKKLSGGNISEDFGERLTSLSIELDRLLEKNNSSKVIGDCRDELIKVTRSYNEILRNGEVPTTLELESYGELIKTCENVLALEYKAALILPHYTVNTPQIDPSTEAKISNIYLKDKYGV